MPTFDSSYYARFYGKDGAHDEEKISHLATAVHNMCAWWGINIRTVLDVGAGMGMWRDWYSEHHPEVSVQSIDVSEHACETWNHELRNIADWTPTRRADLVVCHSVLQYLDNSSFSSAVENLAAGTKWVMYLELPTKWDYENVVDSRGTDMQVYKRSATWYRQHLTKSFTQIGAGLWTPHDGVPMYQLEASR
ncbi:MAG: class I SAM-dependent methyltransferase [Ilumatobacteraceae bacterium]